MTGARKPSYQPARERQQNGRPRAPARASGDADGEGLSGVHRGSSIVGSIVRMDPAARIDAGGFFAAIQRAQSGLQSQITAQRQDRLSSKPTRLIV
jgi:hypothetical protein